MNKQLMFIILIAIVVPPALWLVHTYSRPLPKDVEIDQVAGPPLEYSQSRVAHKDFIISQDYELAASDEDIISRLRQRSNPLYESEQVVVRYDKDQDLFVAEITTIGIGSAKREAVEWFLEQGVSLETICVLPVTFTIDQKSTDELRGLNIRLNPLPSECK